MCTLADWLCARWWIGYAHAGGLVMHTLVDWLCARWRIGYVQAGGLVMHTLVDWLCTRWWIGYVHAGEYNHSGSGKLAVCTQAGDCNRTVCIMCGLVSVTMPTASKRHAQRRARRVGSAEKTSSARWSVVTERTGDRYVLGLSLTPRLLRSPILCRLYKGPFEQTYKPWFPVCIRMQDDGIRTLKIL